ncbi:MAG: hypothetical protein Roseis2KO_12720 [Roseivirga sp.]
MSRFKNTLISWATAYVLIATILYGFNQWLVHYPLYLRTLALSGLMVFVMQYAAFPALQKLNIINRK